MRVSQEKAAENREALLDAAGRLFRARGIDGVGVADIGREAGLTHGALYAHFESKEALAAAALTKGLSRSLQGMLAALRGRKPAFKACLARLFSPLARDTLAMGCPLTASASEAGRQGSAVSASFTAGFREMVAFIEPTLDTRLAPAERHRLATTVIAAQIGAVAVSRAVAKTDTRLSAEVLVAVREVLENAASLNRHE